MTSIAERTALALRDAAIALDAERAREYAAIHRSACRYRAQGLVCSTCFDLDERASRLARLVGEGA